MSDPTLSQTQSQPRVFGKRRFSLQLKLVIVMVIVALTPLVASAYLIDQLAAVAANVSANEAEEHTGPMMRALVAYRELFETTKRLQSEVGARLASQPTFTKVDPPLDLDAVMLREPDLYSISVQRADHSVVLEKSRPLPSSEWRIKEFAQPLANGTVLQLGFAVPAHLQDEYQQLKSAVDQAHDVEKIRAALPRGYRRAFLALLGLAALIAAVVGVLFARRVTRRVNALVATARAVADDQVTARAPLKGDDEMAELGSAFNSMLDHLDATRRQIEYLQRIGAWQDVARRLAHEIKNPLTPIQLAVQQTVSSYRGDDERFRKLLADTGEIVEEEIAGLRRLVDTFRTLGQLPKVEPAPLALAEVIEDLRLDGTMAKQLMLFPPVEPVQVNADKLLLKRVFVNLVENGMHAGIEAGRPGKVEIRWRRSKDDTVIITIDDQGRGIAASERERVFEPYVTTKATGTGLGLAIAKKIILEHGGDLAIDRVAAPTGGARFIIKLPIDSALVAQE